MPILRTIFPHENEEFDAAVDDVEQRYGVTVIVVTTATDTPWPLVDVHGDLPALYAAADGCWGLAPGDADKKITN